MSLTRRQALALTAALAAPAAPAFDADFGDAVSAAEQIRSKRISSVELTKHVFARIDRHNPKINAFTFQLREEAMARAQQADDALAKKQSLGPLHGVPVHVKESFGVQGRPATWGIPAFRNSKAPRNSAVVDKLLGAGAVLIGATNVPLNLLDYQSYNAIYGVTSNPWDLKRTPGGSSGGTAAALAAGLGFLSVGSDIGGSIRLPAHFCGIYGLKPTLGLVSEAGQLPGGNYSDSGFSTELAVAGPMARSARDLDLGIRVLGGPERMPAKAWTWKLPAERFDALKGMRVGYVIDDPIAPLTSDSKPVFENAIRAMEKAGAVLRPGWPASIRIAELNWDYMMLLGAILYGVEPEAGRAEQRKRFGPPKEDPFAAGALMNHADWVQLNAKRYSYRARWEDYFREVDVFLTPVAFTPAFPHQHQGTWFDRTLDTPGGKRIYGHLMNWIPPATLTGCPAAVAPIGRTTGGLPVGIQIMGPIWEDATPIAAARLLGAEIGGFEAPPGFKA
jgi:amidase